MGRITPHMTSVLSIHRSPRDNQQGGHDEFALTMLHIRQAHTRKKPVYDTVRRNLTIPVLEDHLEEGFTIDESSCVHSGSERTIYRTMERYRLRALKFSNISNGALDCHVKESFFSRKETSKCRE